MEREIETKCLHLEEDEGKTDHFGAISYPIYQTATYAHPGVGQSTGYDYSRLQNPTREHLEKLVASLEGGIDARARSSGMAAISLLMELFKPGDHIIADRICMEDAFVCFKTSRIRTAYNFQILIAAEKILNRILQNRRKQSILKHRPTQ